MRYVTSYMYQMSRDMRCYCHISGMRCNETHTLQGNVRGQAWTHGLKQRFYIAEARLTVGESKVQRRVAMVVLHVDIGALPQHCLGHSMRADHVAATHKARRSKPVNFPSTSFWRGADNVTSMPTHASSAALDLLCIHQRRRSMAASARHPQFSLHSVPLPVTVSH
jgi:hypothetical protein